MADYADIESVEEDVLGITEDIDFDAADAELDAQEDALLSEAPDEGVEDQEVPALLEPELDEAPAEEDPDPLADFFKSELGEDKPAPKEGEEAAKAGLSPEVQQYVTSLQQQNQVAQQEAAQLRQELNGLNQNVGQAFKALQDEIKQLRSGRPQPRDDYAEEGDDYTKLFNRIQRDVQARVGETVNPTVERLGGQVEALKQELAAKEHETKVSTLAEQYRNEATQALEEVMTDKVSKDFLTRWGPKMRQKVLAAAYESNGKVTFKQAAQALHREQMEYFRDYHKEIAKAAKNAKAPPKPPQAPAATGVAAKGGRQKVSQADLDRAGYEDHIDWADAGYPYIPPRKKR